MFKFTPLDDVNDSNWSEDKKRILWSFTLLIWLGVVCASWEIPLLGVLIFFVLLWSAKRRGSNLRYATRNFFPDSSTKQQKSLRNMLLMQALVTALALALTWLF